MAGTRAIRIADSTFSMGGIRLVLTLAAAMFVSINMVRAEPPSWQVQNSAGKVEVQASLDPDEHWTTLAPGETIGPLHLIRTGRYGAATLLRQGDKIQMKEEIDLEFPDPEDGNGAKIYQRAGVATYTISNGRPVSIVTPWLVATTRWGTVTVTVKDQGTTVQVHYGTQTISSRFTRSTLVLGEEQQIRVDAGTGPLTPANAKPIITQTALNRKTP